MAHPMAEHHFDHPDQSGLITGQLDAVETAAAALTVEIGAIKTRLASVTARTSAAKRLHSRGGVVTGQGRTRAGKAGRQTGAALTAPAPAPDAAAAAEAKAEALAKTEAARLVTLRKQVEEAGGGPAPAPAKPSVHELGQAPPATFNSAFGPSLDGGMKKAKLGNAEATIKTPLVSKDDDEAKKGCCHCCTVC